MIILEQRFQSRREMKKIKNIWYDKSETNCQWFWCVKNDLNIQNKKNEMNEKIIKKQNDFLKTWCARTTINKTKKTSIKNYAKKSEIIWCALKHSKTIQCFKSELWINNERFKTDFNCLKFVFDETLLIWSNEKQWFWLFD